MPQKRCEICELPEEVREEIKARSQTQSYASIAEWLNTQHGVGTTQSRVQYYLSQVAHVVSRTTPRSAPQDPAHKIEMYMGRLLNCMETGKTYNIRTLHLKGAGWNYVTHRLHRDHLISPLRTYTPVRFEILASIEEMRDWAISHGASAERIQTRDYRIYDRWKR